MWKDAGEKFNRILWQVLSKEPMILPHCCSSPEIHYYLHEHKRKRGSAWIWCSSCKSFSHFDGVTIPQGYTNCPDISVSDLNAEPNILEKKKGIIDSFNSK